MSAPTKAWVMAARRSRSTSGARGMRLLWMFRMERRPSTLGTGMTTSRSNRPGRRRAGSMTSGMFVAPMTMTCPRETMPSMRASSWATTRFSTSPSTSARFGAMASISSMKMTLGALRVASSKISRSLASLSP